MLSFLKKRNKKEKEKSPLCGMVVLAAGNSERMDGINKIFAQIEEIPLIAHTLRAIETCPAVSEIIVVARSEDIAAIGNLCVAFEISKVSKIIRGGASRTQSAYIGAMEVSQKADLIGIHDGARPFVTAKIISEAVIAAKNYTAAAPAVRVKDTIRIKGVDGLAQASPDRERLFAIQTPQVFKAELIKAALQNAIEKKLELTDDCAAAERLGVRAYLTNGSYKNIKITTPEDLFMAKSFLANIGEAKI
jgi:2-C-methyl-D-erythritol 4-phosphate cytidylyltransferase